VETREAILRKKAQALEVKIDNGVLRFWRSAFGRTSAGSRARSCA
jgi:hypothetical protein